MPALPMDISMLCVNITNTRIGGCVRSGVGHLLFFFCFSLICGWIAFQGGCASYSNIDIFFSRFCCCEYESHFLFALLCICFSRRGLLEDFVV